MHSEPPELKDPPLIRLLNASKIIPYRFSLERPLTIFGRTFLQYQFSCERADPHRTDRYICKMNLSKIPVDQTGLQHLQSEFNIQHRIDLIQLRETKWIWYCEKLDNKVILDPPIALPCIFSPTRERWRLAGSYRQINSLFTLSQFGEGLGILASLLADRHSVEFFSDHPMLEIHSTCFGRAIAWSSQYEGIVGTNDDDEDDQDIEKGRASKAQEWKDAIRP